MTMADMAVMLDHPGLAALLNLLLLLPAAWLLQRRLGLPHWPALLLLANLLLPMLGLMVWLVWLARTAWPALPAAPRRSRRSWPERQGGR